MMYALSKKQKKYVSTTKLSDKFKIKVTQWNHFDPEHHSVTMGEADGLEAVRSVNGG
ncbi:MAG TPA: hypothetical protein VFI73_01635 [Candidatus Nitrosopolaris sp.]|nr:hypothetical protein [Candidatus Nitrosopolaris sp.]